MKIDEIKILLNTITLYSSNNLHAESALKDYQIIIDKYEIMTKEKNDSLGHIMNLKKLCDQYWKRIDIYDNNNKFISSCFKDKDFEYYSTDEIDLEYFVFLLDQNIIVSEVEDYDVDNYPIIKVHLINNF